MKNSLFLGLAALAASTTLIAPTVARADDVAREEFSTQVSYADLDLSSARDVARLERRIASKVRRLCDNGGRDLRSRVLQAECRDQSRQKAESQVQLAVANQSRVRRA